MEDSLMDGNFIDQIKSRFFQERKDNGGSPIFWNVTTEERFTISVIGGANTSRQDFSSHVETGSSRQEV